MRLRFISLLAATVALGGSQNVSAEELLVKSPPRRAPVHKPVYKAPIYKAPRPVVEAPGGFYVGGHLGTGWTHNAFADPLGVVATSTFGADSSSILGGVQLGYNWQFN